MLSMGMLVEVDRDYTQRLFNDLVFTAHEMQISGWSQNDPYDAKRERGSHRSALCSVSFTPVSSPDYERWVSTQSSGRFIVTVLARRLDARYLAQGRPAALRSSILLVPLDR